MRDHLDTQIRELTYRLVHLAPEAPPFPEVSMATLTPEKQTSSPRPPRRPSAAWAAAAAFVVVLLIGVPLLFFRGDPEPVAPATTVTTIPDTTVTTVPVAVTSFDVTLYFLADYVDGLECPRPHLVPVRRTIDVVGEGQPTSCLLQSSPCWKARHRPRSSSFLACPRACPSTRNSSDGHWTAQRAPVSRPSTSTGPFESGGGTFSMTSRLAQVVYTATQFADFDEVIISIDGDTGERLLVRRCDPRWTTDTGRLPRRLPADLRRVNRRPVPPSTRRSRFRRGEHLRGRRRVPN